VRDARFRPSYHWNSFTLRHPRNTSISLGSLFQIKKFRTNTKIINIFEFGISHLSERAQSLCHMIVFINSGVPTILITFIIFGGHEIKIES
jgi:hypothetical protein